MWAVVNRTKWMVVIYSPHLNHYGPNYIIIRDFGTSALMRQTSVVYYIFFKILSMVHLNFGH